MNVQWPTAGTWALAACSAIALVAWAIFRSASKADEEIKKQRMKRMQYERTMKDLQEAIQTGNTTRAFQIKSAVDSMRRAGWHEYPLVLALCLSFALAGCKTADDSVSFPPVIVPIGTHIVLPKPGDVVPPLPEGESRWWLCTPTGLALLLPQDSPVLNTKEDDQKKGGN